MHTKELIARNNQKRAQLTKENEAYYSDVLMYVRLKLELSERVTEEMLMEILDDLIEGQNEGKSAVDIFGQDPIAYAETVIEKLPKEKKRHITSFIIGLAATMIGPILIIRGLILGILSFFTTGDESIPLITTGIITLCIIGYIVMVISFVLKRMRDSLVNRTSTVKDALYTGVVAALGMGVLLLIIYLLPTWGPHIEFTWWASFITGIIIWGIIYLINKNKPKASKLKVN